jgi:hypothetical protein
LRPQTGNRQRDEDDQAPHRQLKSISGHGLILNQINGWNEDESFWKALEKLW